jgi:AraC-like DNA-binding protein
MAFQSLLHQHGAPVDSYLRRNGLPTLCNDPNAFLPLLRIWSFFDYVAQHEDPEIGWRVGAHVGDQKLNANLLQKIETAPTLLHGIRRLIQMISSEATDIDIGLHERREGVLLYMHYPGKREVPGYTISQSYQLEFFLSLIRHFLGQHWVPDEIGVESSLVPPMAEEHFPGSQILTQQSAGYIALPRSCLHRAVPTGDAKVSSAENPLISNSSTVLTDNFNYIDMLRTMLKSYLSEGYPSERVAAKLMGTSVRTLTRKLRTHDLTYGMLIDELRFNVAKEKLQTSNMQIGDIALSTGFTDQGNFSRMIRRLSGLTPSQLRKAARNKTETITTT